MGCVLIWDTFQVFTWKKQENHESFTRVLDIPIEITAGHLAKRYRWNLLACVCFCQWPMLKQNGAHMIRGSYWHIEEMWDLKFLRRWLLHLLFCPKIFGNVSKRLAELSASHPVILKVYSEMNTNARNFRFLWSTILLYSLLVSC
jgi:hypothetical protein